MRIDREMQCRVLSFLKKKYPLPGTDSAFLDELHSAVGGGDHGNLTANILYLEEHGLLVSGLVYRGARFELSRSGMRITAKGLDFLEDDGGLSAVLNCVTVRVHDDTIARLESFLAQAPLPEAEKNHLRRRLQELPFDAIKHLLCKLLDLGLEQAPAALQLLQKLLS